jgi:thienamycin biosynthesis protein ThnN
MHRDELNARLRETVALHFDQAHGSPYWIEKARALGIDALHDIGSIDDLSLFGPMDPDALVKRPIEDFVPACYLKDKSSWIIGETGGTTGAPKTAVFREDDFLEAFVRPFVAAAEYRKFPRGENWLWVGPSGPHIIGKAARACARELGSADPFAVDFDPRWVKKFPPESIGFKRYLDHVVEQAMRIISTQAIRVLFSTPRVLLRLAHTMTKREKEAVLGIHFGGMALDPETLRCIREAFPSATFISGYGNTLFGMCPEFMGDPDLPMDYYPLGSRLVFSTVPLDSRLTPEEKLLKPCAPGETGQIVFTRLDKSFLIINQFERDRGELLEPLLIFRELGFIGHGIRNPRPMPAGGADEMLATGLY